MSQQYSSRYKKPNSSRGHVRKPSRQKQFPTWFIGIALVVAAVASYLIVRAVVGLFDNDVAEATQSNRTWLVEAWTQDAPSNNDMAQLVSRLRDNRVKMVYIQTGAWRQDGQYREWPNAADFPDQLQRAASDIKVLVWIWYDPELHANATSQDSLIAYAQNAITEWGYDGLHLQGYNVLNESQNYLDFVQRLNDALPDNHILSITAPPDHNPADTSVPLGLGNPALSWGPDYKGQMARFVDEIVVMPHASGLDQASTYEDWVAYQVTAYARALARVNADTDLIIAFPTYPQELFHNPRVETVTNAASGARSGVQAAGNDGVRVVGAGIYVYDTATDADWQAFAGFWLDE